MSCPAAPNREQDHHAKKVKLWKNVFMCPRRLIHSLLTNILSFRSDSQVSNDCHSNARYGARARRIIVNDELPGGEGAYTSLFVTCTLRTDDNVAASPHGQALFMVYLSRNRMTWFTSAHFLVVGYGRMKTRTATVSVAFDSCVFI